MDILSAMFIMTLMLLAILIVLILVIIATPKRRVSHSRVRDDLRKIKEKISEEDEE